MQKLPGVYIYIQPICPLNSLAVDATGSLLDQNTLKKKGLLRASGIVVKDISIPRSPSSSHTSHVRIGVNGTPYISLSPQEMALGVHSH